MPVTTFLGANLAPRLKSVLQRLDTAGRLREGGHPDAMIHEQQARADLADLVAEVSE